MESQHLNIRGVKVVVDPGRYVGRSSDTHTVVTRLQIGGYSAKLLQSTYSPDRSDGVTTIESPAIAEILDPDGEWQSIVVAETSRAHPDYGLYAALYLIDKVVDRLIDAEAF